MMPEIPTTPSSAVISPTVTSVNAQMLTTAQPLVAHVLSNDKQQISLSVPGHPVLIIDISDNKQAQQLPTGQQVQVTIKQIDQQQLLITLSKVAPNSAPIAEVPLSRDLAAKLATTTSLPNQTNEQLRYIEKNQPVNIGQARRLPNETVKIVTPNLKNITAALPGASLITLNKTYSLALIVMKADTAHVQFTPLPAKEAPVVIQSTVAQLTKSSPLLELNKLVSTAATTALTKSSNIESSGPVNELSSQMKSAKIDMSSPRIQLWLRHQPLAQVMTKLTEVSKEVAQVKLINSPSNTAGTFTAVTPKTAAPVSIAAPNTAQQISSPVANVTQNELATNLTPSKASINLGQTDLGKADSGAAAAPSTSRTDSKLKQENQPPLTPLPPSEQKKIAGNNEHVATTNRQQITVDLAAIDNKQPKLNPTTATADQTRAQVTATLPNQPMSESAAGELKHRPVTGLAAHLTTPPVQPPLKLPNSQQAPTSPPVVKPASHNLKPTQQQPEPEFKKVLSQANLAASSRVKSAAIPSTISPQNTEAKQATDLLKNNATSIAQSHHTKVTTEINNEMANKLSTSAVAEQNQPLKSHFSLQKINALLSSIKTPNMQVTASPAESPANKTIEPTFQAIEKLQSLTKQLQHALPNMQQLTTAPLLPNLIEQFVRFDPLSPASINLTSIGSLAGAIQLLLGARAASSSAPPGPVLTAQLKKILNQNKQSSKQNLLQNLAMLGQHTSVKSLEETLVSLSGHIQLYQYQSQEQSSTNQQIFYFTLPTSESSIPQVEGQIEQQSDPDEPESKSWKLTLLLPVGNTDKLQACAKLQGNNVEIELTSNNNEMVNKAEFFTDFLRRRLETLGLTANNINCTHAQLPKSLLQRPNQLVELII